MGRYGLFPAAAGDGGGCMPLPIVASEGALAVLDGAIATAAFVQLARIHRHNQLQGWTRQKIFHFMIGLSNIVFLVYFVSTIIATCQRWICWVHGCEFVLMASPQILLLASFLLLLSFWVDLCHQTNDEDEEDGMSQSHHEALLDRTKVKPGIRPVNIRQRCCPGIQLGSRQKFVILVLVLSFVVMFAFAILIWVGRGENPIDSSLLKRVHRILPHHILLGFSVALYQISLVNVHIVVLLKKKYVCKKAKMSSKFGMEGVFLVLLPHAFAHLCLCCVLIFLLFSQLKNCYMHLKILKLFCIIIAWANICCRAQTAPTLCCCLLV